MNALATAPVQIEAGIRARLVTYYSERVVAFAESCGIHVHVLHAGETFADASPTVRRLKVGPDTWPVLPSGLFVVAERTVYLRLVSNMVLAHEFAHGLDCALGGGVYISHTNPRFAKAFNAATGFVTPYAASNLDEWFAEGMRALVGANDQYCLWQASTPERFEAVDPQGFALLRATLEGIDA